jgi:molybdopterin converting factor small subunit
MKVRVRLFAAARELAGSDTLEVELPTVATIADMKRAMVASAPKLNKLMPHSLWAIGTEYVTDGTVLTELADVAMIPPVSGG